MKGYDSIRESGMTVLEVLERINHYEIPELHRKALRNLVLREAGLPPELSPNERELTLEELKNLSGLHPGRSKRPEVFDRSLTKVLEFHWKAPHRVLEDGTKAYIVTLGEIDLLKKAGRG